METAYSNFMGTFIQIAERYHNKIFAGNLSFVSDARITFISETESCITIVYFIVSLTLNDIFGYNSLN